METFSYFGPTLGGLRIVRDTMDQRELIEALLYSLRMSKEDDDSVPTCAYRAAEWAMELAETFRESKAMEPLDLARLVDERFMAREAREEEEANGP